MEWSVFANTVDNVNKDAGIQLIQFKALPVGREREALEKIVIQKGFIVRFNVFHNSTNPSSSQKTEFLTIKMIDVKTGLFDISMR